MATGWVKVTNAMGGPAATMHVNVSVAVALTRLTDSTTAIDFQVYLLGGDRSGYRVAEQDLEAFIGGGIRSVQADA